MFARFRFGYGPLLVCGTNMGKVELHDDHRSVSTLQSAVQHTKKKSLDSTGNTKHTILGKNGLVGSNVQMVENML